jgi:hypothetical protein
MQDDLDQYLGTRAARASGYGRGHQEDDPLRDADLELPEDIDPTEMAESIEDELIAEEGEDLGLDPDLAVWTAREDLPLDEGEETTFR